MAEYMKINAHMDEPDVLGQQAMRMGRPDNLNWNSFILRIYAWDAACLSIMSIFIYMSMTFSASDGLRTCSSYNLGGLWDTWRLLLAHQFSFHQVMIPSLVPSRCWDLSRDIIFCGYLGFTSNWFHPWLNTDCHSRCAYPPICRHGFQCASHLASWFNRGTAAIAGGYIHHPKECTEKMCATADRAATPISALST